LNFFRTRNQDVDVNNEIEVSGKEEKTRNETHNVIMVIVIFKFQTKCKENKTHFDSVFPSKIFTPKYPHISVPLYILHALPILSFLIYSL
jgi:hypothetical protein